jgi:hypothetical protein
MYFFTNKNGWENVLQEVEENVKLYLKKEESSILKNTMELVLVLLMVT